MSDISAELPLTMISN